MRLLSAFNVVLYYETARQEITSDNVVWDPVNNNFAEQWKALIIRKDENDPEFPKISKTLRVIKWTEDLNISFVVI